MNLQLAIIALSPAIVLLWIFHAFNPGPVESRVRMALLFVLGTASGLPALVLNHMVEKYTTLWAGAPEVSHRLLFWTLGIGLNEEFAKMMVLLAVLYFRRDFRTPYQGLLGGAAVGLGFAAIENLFYLERFGTVTLLFRSILTVPAHAFFTIPMGVCMAYSRRAVSVTGKYGWLLAGLSAALALHGLYDIWLSLDTVWLSRMAYVQVVLMGMMTLWLMRLRVPSLPGQTQGRLT